MPAEAFRSRWIVCLLMGIAALASTTPLAAAPGGGPQPPEILIAEVLVNGGPTFFANGFEGLGEAVASRNDDAGRGNVATLNGRARFFRGLTTDRSLWDWRQQVLDTGRRSARHDVTVVLRDQTFAEVFRWELKDAWPRNVKYSLAADGSAQEELELAYGAIIRP